MNLFSKHIMYTVQIFKIC